MLLQLLMQFAVAQGSRALALLELPTVNTIIIKNTSTPTATETTAANSMNTKLKPRWDVHLSGDDDQLG